VSLAAGLGGLWLTDEYDGESAPYSGTISVSSYGGVASVLLGGSLAPTLVLGGGLHFFAGISTSYTDEYTDRYSPDVDYSDEGDLDAETATFLVAFAQIFFSERDSFYLRPGVGIGRESSSEDEHGGFLAALGLGYDFALSGDRWWLGPTAQLVVLTGSYDDADYSGSMTLWSASAGLGVTLH